MPWVLNTTAKKAAYTMRCSRSSVSSRKKVAVPLPSHLPPMATSVIDLRMDGVRIMGSATGKPVAQRFMRTSEQRVHAQCPEGRAAC